MMFPYIEWFQLGITNWWRNVISDQWCIQVKNTTTVETYYELQQLLPILPKSMLNFVLK